MAFIQGVNRNQKLIFPEYLEDSIGEENPVRVIDAYADTLNLKQMGFTKTIEYRCGAPSYNPKDLLKLYIYGYINAIRSSRKLERETYRNIEVMWLLRKIQPDFKTIADFRKENKNILKKVFKNFTLLCTELELLADKGYYQANDLKKREENGTTTCVTKQISSNATGVREFYGDKFKYDKERDIYICPQGKELYRMNHRIENPKRVKYRNFKACGKCEYKDSCTTSKKGREITRAKDQDFLDIVDVRTRYNFDKYLQRQMIVEHPFGTIKRTMNAGYYLTRGMESVEAETALIMLSYNIKRAINIIGVKELIRKIRSLRTIFLPHIQKLLV